LPHQKSRRGSTKRLRLIPKRRALFDGFISWKAKNMNNTARPETIIKLLDPTWRPYIQACHSLPYVSGHSVISAAAAGDDQIFW